MNCPYSSFRTVAYPLPSPIHNPKSLVAPNFTSFSALNSGKFGASVYWNIVLKPVEKTNLRVRASTSDDAGTEKWLKWIPNGALAADKVLRLVAGATASPISQFISSPVTFLHSVDPRIKLVNFFFFPAHLLVDGYVFQQHIMVENLVLIFCLES